MDDGLWPEVNDAIQYLSFMVLILVLVDDGLWQSCIYTGRARQIVLILVLVDDGLWPWFNPPIEEDIYVLILVLVDDGLWHLL